MVTFCVSISSVGIIFDVTSTIQTTMSSQIPFLSPGEMETLMSLPSGGLGAASAMTSMYPPASLSSSSCNFFALAPNQPGMHVAGMMGLPQAPRPVPEFLYHLTRMLREPSSHRLIEWDAGRILVHDPVRLESEVLGKYYRHSKYPSFQRQLNYFGFKKISGKRKMSPCSYTNVNVTDSLDSLIRLRRKPVKKHRPARPSEDGEQRELERKDAGGGGGGTGNGHTKSKKSVLPVPSSLGAYANNTATTSDANSSNSDSEHGHTIDLDSFRSGLCGGGLNGLFSDSFQTQATTTTNNNNHSVLPAISSAIAATEYCTQPLLVTAEEFKAPGDCAPLQGVLPVPTIGPPLPFPVSRSGHRHQPVVTPLHSSLSFSDSSTSSTAVQSAMNSLPLPNIFSVQHLLQRQQEQSASETLNHPADPSQLQHQQEQCQRDADDDIATFLALESVFGAGFDERSDSAEDNRSEGSTSVSGDSWVPDHL